MILDFNSLNDVQIQAVKAVNGPIIVSAGAGSGKTRVLTYRVANLILNNNIAPENILAITFTNKAAAEMRNRLQTMMNINRSTICTFHALGVKILRECFRYIAPRNQYFSIYDESDKKGVIKSILKEMEEDSKMMEFFMDTISKAKNSGMSPSQCENVYAYHPKAKILARVYELYEKALENNNAFDFDDLLCKPFELMKSNADIREFYQDRFKYILVDEFQDTNEIQYNFLRLLSAKHRNIFVVGDEDQSIYSWRGADSHNMFKFIEDFRCEQVFKLEQNYRSTDKILNAANKVISKNKNRLDKKLWTNIVNGKDINYKCSSNEHTEAENVVRNIYRMVNSFNCGYNDIAVLVRMNSLTRVLEDKFLQYNIPYKIYGGVKFYDRAEVKNILAYLKCISNKKDDENFLRIINFPRRKIGEVAVANLKQLSSGFSLMEGLLNLDESSDLPKAQLQSFLSVKQLFIDLIENSKTMKISKFVEYLFSKIEIEKVYDKDNEEELSRLMNVKELQNAIKEFENQNPNSTLDDYLQAVTLISDIDSYESEDDTVTIATVHAVKGLEFKKVFIVGLEENIFPLIRQDSADLDESLEEERRLMYVAITRAKDELFLSNSSQRALYGKRETFFPSRYLEELGYVKKYEQHNNFLDDDYYSYNSYDRPRYGNNYDRSGYNNNYERSNYGSSNGYYSKNNYVTSSNYSSGKSNNSSILNTYERNFNVTNKTQSVSNNYKDGQKVKHPKYGNGIVVKVNNDCNCVSVAFEGIGIKNLDITMAKLEIC